jgi:hypothetical protein
MSSTDKRKGELGGIDVSCNKLRGGRCQDGWSGATPYSYAEVSRVIDLLTRYVCMWRHVVRLSMFLFVPPTHSIVCTERRRSPRSVVASHRGWRKAKAKTKLHNRMNHSTGGMAWDKRVSAVSSDLGPK